MTRRRREIERAIEDLEDTESSDDADPTGGVTADFVTFDEDGDHSGDAPAEFIAFTEGDEDT